VANIKKKKVNEIEVVAPMRIDLAGGTLDIWPLYLFLKNPQTLNLAISLYARVKITLRKDSKIVIKSTDLKKQIEFQSISNISHEHGLSLVSRILSFFSPECGLTVETCSDVPAGTGLAGSSTLNIALCYAMNKLMGKRYSKSELQTIAKNIEAQVIKVPTGDQDYYPALFGGLNSIQLLPSGVLRKPIKCDLKELKDRLVLVYSGDSRKSGINNWDIYKRVIEGDKNILKRLNNISEISGRMKEALEENNFSRIGNLLGTEWMERKKLCKEVSTSAIEDIISFSLKNGAIASKVCGAGGGGCILLFTEPDGQKRLKEALSRQKVRFFDFTIDSKGVREVVGKI
jgi:D-glycero-alpha-D-manno-heptose-7-phosphate kinase